MKSKKLFLSRDNEKYCVVKLYDTNKKMQRGYDRSVHKNVKDYAKVLGAHCGYVCIDTTTGKEHPETGTIFLSLENCGAGIAGHEIMHAVLWGWKHKSMKRQYPIKIKNMDEEEEILHSFTHMISQFYDWYWSITDEGKFI